MLMLAECSTHMEQLLSGSIAVRTTSITLHLRVIEKVLLAIVSGHYVSLQLLGLGMLVESLSDILPICTGLKFAACQLL